MLGNENFKSTSSEKYYKVKPVINNKSVEKNNYNDLPNLNSYGNRQHNELMNSYDNKIIISEDYKKFKQNNASNLPKYKSRQQNNQIQQDRVLYSSYQNIYNDISTAKLINSSPPRNELLLKKLFDEQSEIIKTYKESASKLIKEREDYIRETQILKEKINYSRNIQKNILNKLEFHNYFEKMIEKKVENLLQKSCNFDNRRENSVKNPTSDKYSSNNRPMSQHSIRNNSINSSNNLPVIIQSKVVKKFKTNDYIKKDSEKKLLLRPPSSKNSVNNSHHETQSCENSTFNLKLSMDKKDNEVKNGYLEKDQEILNKSSNKELDSNLSSKLSKLSKISKPSKISSNIDLKKEFEKSLNQEKIIVGTEKSQKEYNNLNPTIEISSDKKANSDKVINSKEFLNKPIKIKRNNIIRPHIPVYKVNSNSNAKQSMENIQDGRKESINSNSLIQEEVVNKISIKNDSVKSIKEIIEIENHTSNRNEQEIKLNTSSQINLTNRSQYKYIDSAQSKSPTEKSDNKFNEDIFTQEFQVEAETEKKHQNSNFNNIKRYYNRNTNNKSAFLTGIKLENHKLEFKIYNTIKQTYSFSKISDEIIIKLENLKLENRNSIASSKNKIQLTDGIVYKKKSKILLGNVNSSALSNSYNKSDDDDIAKLAYEKKISQSKNNIHLKKVKLENVKKLPTINASLTNSPKAKSIKSEINSKASSVHKNNDNKISIIDDSSRKLDVSNEDYKSKLLNMITNIKETNFEYSKSYHNQNKFSFDNSNIKKDSNKTLPYQGSNHENMNIEVQSIPEEEKDCNDNDYNNLDISNCNSETERKREMNLLRNIQTPGFNKNTSDDENTTKPVIKEDPYVKSKFRRNYDTEKNLENRKIDFTFKKSNIKFNKGTIDKEPLSSQFDNNSNLNKVSKIY
jgi:hypothetical protein